MKTTVLSALLGAAFLLPLQGTAQAAENTPEVRACVRDIAQQERSAARQTTGEERRALIKALGAIKIACMNGETDKAYKAAAKLKLNPQSARAQ